MLWGDLLRGNGDSRFKHAAELKALFTSLGVRDGDLVVTYCAVGMRASISYFVARLLGYEARMYDGSYDDWSQRRLPLVKGPKPLG